MYGNTMHPAWFEKHISAPRDDHFVSVQGCNIHYQSWAAPNVERSLVLIHGHGAHTHWWDFIAPAFIENYRVVAIDLSGAGDSGHRPQYSTALFCDEIASVINDADLISPLLLGHSFGGSLARTFCFLHPGLVSGLILADSAISVNHRTRALPVAPRGNIRYYRDLSEGVRRFRLRPPQPCENAFLVDYIARHSLMESAAGFCFKLDQALFAKMVENPENIPDSATMLRALTCPIAMIYGDRSRFFGPEAVALVRQIFLENNILKIEQAHHHTFLDKPQDFITALDQLLTRWSTSAV
jgi:pimeloyl-ACP methyl ester carboxylesterase